MESLVPERLVGGFDVIFPSEERLYRVIGNRLIVEMPNPYVFDSDTQALIDSGEVTLSVIFKSFPYHNLPHYAELEVRDFERPFGFEPVRGVDVYPVGLGAPARAADGRLLVRTGPGVESLVLFGDYHKGFVLEFCVVVKEILSANLDLL